MPVDTRTAVPTAVASFVAHTYCNCILLTSLLQVWSNVVVKGRIAIGMVAKMMSIHPYIAIHINAIKQNRYFFSIRIIHRKMLAIPGSATYRITSSCFADAVLCKTTCHTIQRLVG